MAIVIHLQPIAHLCTPLLLEVIATTNSVVVHVYFFFACNECTVFEKGHHLLP